MTLSSIFRFREKQTASAGRLTVESDTSVRIDSPLFQAMSPALQDQVVNHEHLWRYLNRDSVQSMGVPEFLPRLVKVQKNLRQPNLIYPTGGNVFVHLYQPEDDSRNCYFPIEPGEALDGSGLIQEIDRKLIDHVGELQKAAAVENR